jgi:hypothetical protein
VVSFIVCMAVVKLSKSGKGLLIVGDDGVVYFTSVFSLKGLLEGRIRRGLVQLGRFGEPVSIERFGRSPVWNPVTKQLVAQEGVFAGNGVSIVSDAFRKVRDASLVRADVVVKDVEDW